MKTYKLAAIFLSILSAFIYYGCDDSGVQHSIYPRGIISMSQQNLKHLDQITEGIFELWLRLDSSGVSTYYSLGKFNIDNNGNVVDPNGGSMTFTFQGDTNKLYQTVLSFITVEPPADSNSGPSSSVLLSGQTVINADSIYATLKMSGDQALGAAGIELLKGATAFYSLATPTNGFQDCLKGAWFCDSNQVSSLPNGIKLVNPGWVYEGWVKDVTNPNQPIYYSMGRFTDPNQPDFDGAGPCAGSSGPPYSKPGQDWVQTGCPMGVPQIQDISNGNYEILLTLEPAFEQGVAYNNPFFLVLFKRSPFPWGCKKLDYFLSQFRTYPQARIRITY